LMMSSLITRYSTALVCDPSASKVAKYQMLEEIATIVNGG